MSAEPISESKLKGTNAQRLALDTSSLRTGDEFYTDEGDAYKLFGTAWYQILIEGATSSYDAYKTAGEDLDADVLMTERRAGYETVAASQTDQVLGVTGAVGDLIDRLVIVPATINPGAVTIKDGGGSAITVYTGGTVGADLTPITIELNIESAAGAWSVTTLLNESAIAIGRFS